ncbi:HinT-interacting membrane complex protein P80 [Mycoplasmopsis edwardii]|uniref:Uncharacterized protein n=1 Tax=Mycoplasmopsis edwardii TaxID=53558 RepID=A0ACD4PIY8_9BACT|nr:hypothetical protein [Mycoplasmopsis edwardii]WBP84008.1 hypothetical protein Me_995_000641 [Mycoplasmopsis edwardii]
MAKRQRSFLERLSEINDNYDEKNKKVATKTKRNWINYGILGALAFCVILGITIPLVINTTKVNYIDAKSGDSDAFTFDNSKKITVEEFVKQLENNKTEYSEKFNDAYKKAVFYMYEKEHLASKQYQEIFNNSLNANENSNLGLELKSIDEIKENQKNKLEDLKNNFKKTYGYSTWENIYKERLLSEEYGKSTTDEQAIEYLTFKEIESSALRSFEVEVKTLDLSFINKTAKKDIYQIDSNGNIVKGENGEAKVLFKQGEKVFPYFVENENYFVQESNPSKATVFVTKSFIPELIPAKNLVTSYFMNNDINLSSSVLLPGVQNSDLRFAFNLKENNAKEKFLNNLKYSVYKDESGALVVSKNSDILKSFKKPESYGVFDKSKELDKFNDERKVYETYLDALTLTKGDTLGFLGVSNIKDLVNSNVDLAFASIANEVLKDGSSDFKEIDLDKLFQMPSGINPEAEAKITQLINDAKVAKDDASITNENEKSNKISSKLQEANELIQKYFDELTEEQFNKVIIENYNSQFNTDINNKTFTSLVYKIKDKDDSLLVLTPKGISIFNNQRITTIDKFNELLKSDLENIAKGAKSYFNLQSKINSFKSKENTIITQLENESFKTWLLTQKDSKGIQYTDQSIQDLLAEVKSVKVGNDLLTNISLFEKTDKFINDKLNSLNNLNFTNVDGKVKVNYLNVEANSVSQSDKTAFDLTTDAIQSVMKKGGK